MNRKPISALATLGALALLCACSTQPSSEATQPEPQQAGAAPGQASARPAASSAMQGGAMKDEKAAKRSVYYDFDRYEIKADQLGTVEANAKYLRANPETKVRIEGNADERGSREYNLALGQRRAESVMKSMKLLGVREARMESVSYGNEKPKAAGHDEQSWSENRRSDIVYP
jgi:peptidoglycan-associated lipoprotein